MSPPSTEGVGVKGTAKLCCVRTAEQNEQSGLELYRTRTILCGSGYHRAYGETTKHAAEASVLTDQLSGVGWDVRDYAA